MTNTKRWGAIAAALVTGFLALGSARAAPPDRDVYQFKGLSAYASIYGYSDECTYTSVYISASESMTHTAGGPPETGEGLYVDYSRYNYCTGESSYGSGFTSDVAISGNINTGVSVNATLPVYDYYNGTTRTMTVNVFFEPTGSSGHSVYQDTYKTPYSRAHYRSVGRNVSATVSGSITLDGVELFTSTMEQYGSISDARSGSVTIYRQ